MLVVQSVGSGARLDDGGVARAGRVGVGRIDAEGDVPAASGQAPITSSSGSAAGAGRGLAVSISAETLATATLVAGQMLHPRALNGHMMERGGCG